MPVDAFGAAVFASGAKPSRSATPASLALPRVAALAMTKGCARIRSIPAETA
jgi:hypothetical protein